MATIVIRTLIIYILLTFSLRIMGKRQIGELDVGELVSTLLISEIAALPIDDTDIPLFNAIIPTLIIISLEIIVSTIKNKSEKLKRTIEGEPIYVIYKGKILQDALSNNRISVNELLSELRSQGVGDVGEIYYAIIEQNGSISLIKKDDSPLAHSIIIDGVVITKNLERLGHDSEWLYGELSERSLEKTDIYLMTLTDGGEMNIIIKEGKNDEG